MASKPKRSSGEASAPADATGAAAALRPGMARTARPLRGRTDGVMAGAAVRGAVTMARHLDVALSRRTDGRAPAGARELPTPTLPWGVWPAAAAVPDDRAAVLGSALASYAAFLRARKGGPPPPPARGLPLLARRRGATSHGPHRGPGGLARAMVPVDQPIGPPEPAAPSAHAGAPGAGPAPRSARRTGGR